MKISRIETRVLEMPYTKPLVTATNNFTVARGLLVKVVTDERRRRLRLFGSISAHGRDAADGATCDRSGTEDKGDR